MPVVEGPFNWQKHQVSKCFQVQREKPWIASLNVTASLLVILLVQPV